MSERGTVLLVEDDKAILRTNRRILEQEGFTVLCAGTLAEARALVADREPDVLVLDIMLPDGSGRDFCDEIREDTAAPVLFLTALDNPSEVIDGLAAGGNDYITKPYSVEEFAARVKAQFDLARRIRQRAGKQRVLPCGPLELDLVSRRAYLCGTDMLLTHKEFAVLQLLAQNEGRPLSPEKLYEDVWKQPMAGDAQSIKTVVSRLRKKLKPAGLGIEAVRGEGYRFRAARPG